MRLVFRGTSVQFQETKISQLKERLLVWGQWNDNISTWGNMMICALQVFCWVALQIVTWSSVPWRQPSFMHSYKLVTWRTLRRVLTSCTSWIRLCRKLLQVIFCACLISLVYSVILSKNRPHVFPPQACQHLLYCSQWTTRSTTPS